jgi:DNA-binding transcriptional LysR family regulator
MTLKAERLGRSLKLHGINVLLEVARCGSMGKAAAQLSLSQPAISKGIAEMESALGVRLLDRTPRGVEPTIYGRALLDHGLIALDELRQAVKRIEFLANPSAGEVHIASSLPIAAGFVASVVDALARRHRDIVFHLSAAESGVVYTALEERRVDLAVVRTFDPTVPDHLEAEILYHEGQIVVTAAQNRWARRRKVDLADLMEEAWILPPPDSLSGSVIDEAFRHQGLERPRTVIVAQTVPVRTALVASGKFLTIVPESVMRFPGGNPDLRRLPIDLSVTHRPIAVITLKGRTLNPIARLFIEGARDLAARLARDH